MTNIPRWILYLLLVVLYLLHNDIWFWHNPDLVLGLPVGLMYHAFYCVVSSAVFYLLIKSAWPKFMQEAEEGNQP